MMQPTLLTNLQALEELILNNYSPDKYKEPYAAVSSCKIVINEDGERIRQEKQNTESILFILINSFPSLVVKACEVFDESAEGYKEHLTQNDIDVLLIEEQKAGTFQRFEEEIGRCVFHSGMTELPDYTSVDCVFGIEKHQCYEHTQNEHPLIGWSSLLKEVDLFPTRRMVIQDNYLFANNPEYAADNLLELIRKFVKPGIEYELSLLILTLGFRNNERAWFEDWISKLKKKVLNTLGCAIQIGIVLHPYKDKHHKRQLISDYSISKSDWGFNAFQRDKATHDNDIHLRGIFSGLNRPGDSTIKTLAYERDKINKTILRIQKAQDAGLVDNTRMVIGELCKTGDGFKTQNK